MITSTPIKPVKELTDKDFELDDRSKITRRDASWPIQIQTRQKTKANGRMISVSIKSLIVNLESNLKPQEIIFLECASIHQNKRRFLQAICQVKTTIACKEGFRTTLVINNATALTKTFLASYTRIES